MLKNYFTTALRNLLQHKLYSFINIGGLSIGFAACILILLFVRNELSYDEWLPNSEKIHRLEVSYLGETGEKNNPMALSPGAIGKPLAKNFPNEIEALARLRWEQVVFKKDETKFFEVISLVDSDFFKVLDLPMISGDRSLAFRDHKSLIISESMSKKYFGNRSPIGETLEINNGALIATVVAVMANVPENSHFTADFIIHLNEANYDDQPWTFKWWNSSNVYTYLKLKDPKYKDILESSIPSFTDENAVRPPFASTSSALSDVLSFSLMPVRDIHLHSKGRFQLKTTGDITVVIGFSLIAALILVIAVINFTNLSTARASLRAKEIAVRKVVGASRSNIIHQFLGETFITTLIAVLIAFALVELTLPWFNELIVKVLDLTVFTDPLLQLGLIGVVAVVGIGAGAHPAFAISKFKPAKILHSTSSSNQSSGKFRFLLTTVQFTISIALIIGTAIVYSQVNHAQSMENGINKDHKLALSNMDFGPVADVASTIKTEIETLPGVVSTSFSARDIPLTGYQDWPVRLDGDTDDEIRDMEIISSGFNFLQLYDAKLIAGRYFSKDRRADLYQPPVDDNGIGRQSAIITENAVSYLGFGSADNAIGKTIYIDSGSQAERRATTIVGVVADMQLRSARDVMDRSVFLVDDQVQQVLYVDIHPNFIPETVAAIEAIWNRLVPDLPQNQFFVDESFKQFYQADKQRAQIFAYFALFAVFVSCLGLYGLASFTTERRTKEIGIRKIMGAKVGEIVQLLTFQFSKPVLVANIIAWPITWYFAHDWLQEFTYRIELNALYFVAAGALTLAISCLTVAGHALRVARANPVEALRST